MRVVQHRLETSAALDRIWAALMDVAHWPDWQDSVAQVSFEGPLAPGKTGRLILRPGGPRTFSVESLKPRKELVLVFRGWAREARLIHRVESTAMGCRLGFRVEINGAGAWMDPWFRQATLEQSLPEAARALARLCAVNPR